MGIFLATESHHEKKKITTSKLLAVKLFCAFLQNLLRNGNAEFNFI